MFFLLYIYQLEFYSKKRFLRFVYLHFGFLKKAERGKLDWTTRSRLIFVISIFLELFFVALSLWYWGLWGLFFSVIFGIFIYPLVIILSDIIIFPLVLFQKYRIIRRARLLVRERKKQGLIVVGITGSFGKTTMKNVLVHVLQEKLQVFTFSKNVNTDIGVSQQIIEDQEKLRESDVVVVEMGAFRRGDIKALCNVLEPDYSIITSIGESHLERFGSFENIVKAKFELANATRKEVFLNICDENVHKHCDKSISPRIPIHKICGTHLAKNREHLPDFSGISFDYKGQHFETKLIADYVVDFGVIAFELAEKLGMSLGDMYDGFKKLDYVPHRLQVIYNKDFDRVIIDDSYNGNFAGFLAGLRVLERAKGRKIVLTPGIVELGNTRSREVHSDLAKMYQEKLDYVLLIENKNTKIIQEIFESDGFQKYIMYKTAAEAHEKLATVLQNGDTILFQNDITDNYV